MGDNFGLLMLSLVVYSYLFYLSTLLFGLVLRRGGGAAVAVMFIVFAFVLFFERYWCIIGAFVGVAGALGCSSAFLCLPLPSSAFLCLPLPSSAFLCRICQGRTLRENRLIGLGKAFQGFFASNKGNVVYRNVDFLCFFSDTNSGF